MLFFALSISAIALFPGYYVPFVVLLYVDGIATLVNFEIAVSADRSVFFLALLALTVFTGSHGLLFLFLETLVVIAALDVSFLLRGLAGTLVEASVIGSRLRSYLYTLVPAFLFSYLAVYAYTFAADFSSAEPVVLLIASSSAALVAVYAISRYLSPRAASRR